MNKHGGEKTKNNHYQTHNKNTENKPKSNRCRGGDFNQAQYKVGETDSVKISVLITILCELVINSTFLLVYRFTITLITIYCVNY